MYNRKRLLEMKDEDEFMNFLNGQFFKSIFVLSLYIIPILTFSVVIFKFYNKSKQKDKKILVTIQDLEAASVRNLPT